MRITRKSLQKFTMSEFKEFEVITDATLVDEDKSYVTEEVRESVTGVGDEFPFMIFDKQKIVGEDDAVKYKLFVKHGVIKKEN